jgi:hypothetical protein
MQSSGLGPSDKYDPTKDESYEWTIRNLRKYTHHLSNTIETWESFNRGQIRYFYKDFGKPTLLAPFRPYIAAINREVDELISLRTKLQHQTKMFENIPNSVSDFTSTSQYRLLIKF